MSGSPSWGPRQFRVVTVRWSRYGHAAEPARRAVGVRRNPCGLTSSACGASAFSAARRATWLRSLQLVRALLGCAGSRIDRPVVGPLYRHDRTVTPGRNRSAKPVSGVPAVGQASSHSEPIRSGALPAQGHSIGAGRRQRQRPVGPLPCPYRVHRTVTRVAGTPGRHPRGHVPTVADEARRRGHEERLGQVEQQVEAVVAEARPRRPARARRAAPPPRRHGIAGSAFKEMPLTPRRILGGPGTPQAVKHELPGYATTAPDDQRL